MGLFCKHNYNVIKQIAVYDGYIKDMPIYHKLVLCCKKCGKVKTKKI